MSKESIPPGARHLLMLLSQDLNSPSGLGRFFPLAKYLVKAGMRVTILALHSDYEGLAQKDFWRDRVHVRYVAQMHVHKDQNRTNYFRPLELIYVAWQATRALTQVGMKEDVDVVFVGKPHPMNGIAGWLITRKKEIPLIVDCDDYEAESNHFSGKWQKVVVRFFEDTLPKKADLVTTNTFFNFKRLVKLGVKQESMLYLPNGVDPQRFYPLDEHDLAALRQKIGLSSERVVAYLGSLNLANHPVDSVIRSFKILHNLMPETSLLIVGGGKDSVKLRQMATDLGLGGATVFTGRVPPENMAGYYQLADVTVDPADDTEANQGRCPLKLFESWFMGVPFVTIDTGDRRKLAGEPPAALLARPGDENDLALKFHQVLSDEDLSRRLISDGLERVKNYDWEAITQGAYQRIISSRSRWN